MYGDKLIETKDMENFKKLKFDISKQFFDVSIIICIVFCVSTLILCITSYIYLYCMYMLQMIIAFTSYDCVKGFR